MLILNLILFYSWATAFWIVKCFVKTKIISWYRYRSRYRYWYRYRSYLNCPVTLLQGKLALAISTLFHNFIFNTHPEVAIIGELVTIGILSFKSVLDSIVWDDVEIFHGPWGCSRWTRDLCYRPWQSLAHIRLPQWKPPHRMWLTLTTSVYWFPVWEIRHQWRLISVESRRINSLKSWKGFSEGIAKIKLYNAVMVGVVSRWSACVLFRFILIPDWGRMRAIDANIFH